MIYGGGSKLFLPPNARRFIVPTNEKKATPKKGQVRRASTTAPRKAPAIAGEIPSPWIVLPPAPKLPVSYTRTRRSRYGRY